MKDRLRLQDQREFQEDWPVTLSSDEIEACNHWFKENYPHQRKLFAFPERWD